MLRILLLITLVFGRTCSGLKCWRCDGKRTVKECHAQFGKMQECNPGEVCQNDFRTANGETIITKGCKQKTACETEVKQNKDKNQCGSKLFRSNMACRCCCSTTGCNQKKSGCLPPPPPCLKSQIKVRNARLFCSDIDIKFGTRCKFVCNPGYKREGPLHATCKRHRGKQGKWDVTKPPVCFRTVVRCFPMRKAIPNGNLRCFNTKEFARYDQFNYLGSECHYSCAQNHYLVGKEMSTCQEDREWSSPQPRCRRGSCKVGGRDRNRIAECTDGYKFGSKCVFSCATGYKLIGREKSDCRQIADTRSGLWSNGLPTCKEIECSVPQNPNNGKVECSNGRKLNSTCVYRCNSGFDLDDTEQDILESTCRFVDKDKETADWFPNPPPTCSRIRCIPPTHDPFNGLASCSKRNWLGSVCTLSCNDGFFFETGGLKTTSYETVCKNDGNGDMFGQWSRAAAAMDCKPLVCEAEIISVENTITSCSDGNHLGSECIVTCIEGYAFIGEYTQNKTNIVTKCRNTHSGSVELDVSWTNTDFRCVPITCKRLDPIEYGSTECSTDGPILINDRCEFRCNAGFRLLGSPITWCQDLKGDGDDVGDWTNDTPECILDPCEMPAFDESRVMQECISPIEGDQIDFRMNTECRYRCKSEGLYMVNDATNDVIAEGGITMRCLASKKWTDSTPRCDVKVCDPLPTPRDGYEPICTNGRQYLSECVFVCHDKYEITQPKPLVCISSDDNSPKGVWSQEVPECMRSHCDDFGIVKHGRLDCTDGSRIGSVCTLSCKDRYTVKHYKRTECLDTVEWSHDREDYFCCVRCKFNVKIRIVAVFDAAAVSTKLDWEYMVDLTESYLALLIQNGFDVQFSAFLYGRTVDRKSIYKWVQLHDRENISAAAEHLEYMCNLRCLREDEGNTADALRYINAQVFKTVSQEREQFVIIRTRGRSRDDTVKVAKRLQRKNVNILTIGINNKNDATARLQAMAGKERNFLRVQKPSDLKDIPAKIVEISRDTGCTDASKSNSCT